MEAILMLAGALLLDLLAGEYPGRWHPVVWMGVLTDRLLDLAPRQGDVAQLAFGALLVLAVAGLSAGAVWLVLDLIRQQNPGFAVVAGAVLLKPAFSIRALWRAARRVQAALAEGDLEEARRAVGHLVSRDTGALSQRQVASAAVESVAENFTDSVVAPLAWYVLLGPAGAMAYRAVNTLDAMVGYRGRFEYLGKAAARLDDVLNLVPARLAAAFLVAAAPFTGAAALRGARTAWREHRRTASPNAGWTMGAMAGCLGVRLEKPGVYTLGAGYPMAAAGDIDRALRLYRAATALFLACTFVLLAAIHAG